MQFLTLFTDSSLRNARLIVLCQLFFMIGNMMFVTLAPVLGSQLGLQEYATLPLAFATLSMLIFTLPLSKLMQRWGRQTVFMLALLANMTASLLMLLAIYVHQGGLLLIACLVLGINMAAANYYRFAAMELVQAEQQSLAISSVMAVGVLAAVLGPNLASFSQHWWLELSFAASVLLLVPLSLMSLIAIKLVDWPTTPLKSTATQPVIIHWRPLFRPMFSAAAGFGVMVMIMSATPLHMTHHHFEFKETAWVIQWHILGMFAPSFFMPWLLKRLSVARVIQLGALIIIVSSLLNLVVTSKLGLTVTLMLLGIGWNFMFIASSQALMAFCQTDSKHKIQAGNEMLVYSFAAFATFSSGYWLHHLGWWWLNLLALPLPLIALIWWFYPTKPAQIKQQ